MHYSSFNLSEIKKIPSTPGVYIFMREDMPLYIGKSIRLHSRIIDHLNKNNTKSLRFVEQTTEIRILPTAGELGALVRESKLIKSLYPVYNKRLRREKYLSKVVLNPMLEGFLIPQFVSDLKIFNYQEFRDSFVFRSRRSFKEYLKSISKYPMMCPKLLGLEKAKGACFNHQLGSCMGACVGKVSPDLYNAALQEYFKNYEVITWPYPDSVIVSEKSNEISETFVIRDWVIKSVESKNTALEIEDFGNASIDEYKIVRQYVMTKFAL